MSRESTGVADWGLPPTLGEVLAAIAGAALRKQRIILIIAGLALAGAAWEATRGDAVRATALIYIVPILTSFVVGLLTMSGIVSDDRTSGVILLWYQRPGTLIRWYAVRYLLIQGLLAVAGVVCGAALLLIRGARGSLSAGDVPVIVAAMVSLAVVSGAIVFCFSCWGARRDSTLAVIFVFVSVAAVAGTAFETGATQTLIRSLAFPGDGIFALAAGRDAVAQQYSTPLIPIAQVAGHIAVWTAAGFVGLRWLEARLATRS